MGKLWKDPFSQLLLLLVIAWLFFKFGIKYLSAPIPSTLINQYMGITLGVLLLYNLASEERWTAFKVPITKILLGATPAFNLVRTALFILLPIYVGFQTYHRLKPSTTAPPPFRTVHPANPSSITFRGETLDLTTLTNPLRADEANHEANLEKGKQVYYERCFFCHGDTWSADGHFAEGFVPVPAKFTGDETLAILTESYVFWRIAKGGPGLPTEGTPWNSAMPAWEDRLQADEIWAVIMYLYDAIGKNPREQGGQAGEGGH